MSTFVGALMEHDTENFNFRGHFHEHSLGYTPRGSCSRTLLRRVLRRVL